MLLIISLEESFFIGLIFISHDEYLCSPQFLPNNQQKQHSSETCFQVTAIIDPYCLTYSTVVLPYLKKGA